MTRATKGITWISLLLSAVLLIWAVLATHYILHLWPAASAALPPPDLWPEDAGLTAVATSIAAASAAAGAGSLAEAVGVLVSTLIELLIRGLAAVIVSLQALLGLGLGLAAVAIGRGWRLSWTLHVVWSLLALVIEVPMVWLLGVQHQHGTDGGLLAIAVMTALYALFLLFVGPILRHSGRWPWPLSRSPSNRKPKPLFEDWA